MAENIQVRRKSDGATLEVSRKHWNAALSANPDFELADPETSKSDGKKAGEKGDKTKGETES